MRVLALLDQTVWSNSFWSDPFWIIIAASMVRTRNRTRRSSHRGSSPGTICRGIAFGAMRSAAFGGVWSLE